MERHVKQMNKFKRQGAPRNLSLASRLYSAELAKVKEVRALLYDSEEDEFYLELNEGQPTASGKGTTFRGYESSQKLIRLMLEFSAKFCHIDLMAEASKTRPQSARIPTALGCLRVPELLTSFWSSPIELSDWGRAASKKAWPKLMSLLYFACTIHLACNLYHQYAYDYYLFRLARVRWLNVTQVAETATSGALEREDYLIGRLIECAHQLEFIGAPNMQLSFVVQIIHLLITLGSLFFYLGSYYYFARISAFDFYFVRNFFDYSQEQRRSARFVDSYVRNVIHSISNWSRSLLDSSMTTRHDDQLLTSCGTGLIDCATIRESQACKQLEEMLLVGHLRPLNQRAKWVGSWCGVYIRILLTCNLYVMSSNVIIISLLIAFLDKRMSELNISEWLNYAEMAYLLTVIQISAALYGATLTFTCWDLARLVDKLRRLLRLTIELNNLRFYGHRGDVHDTSDHRLSMDDWAPMESRASKMDKKKTTFDVGKLRRDQMNRDILLFFMHYRLFVTQVKKLKSTLGMITASAVFIMFITPTLSRLHVPYFQPLNTMQTMRLLVVMVSCMVMIPADIYIVPVCYLNKRCIDLYCDLNSLLAHVTQISMDSRQADENISHDHYIIVSLLRKELSNHDQLTRQLTIKFLGLSFTYETLVRLHFYVGFIVLTIMGENVAYLKEPTGTIFTDPLGLF